MKGIYFLDKNTGMLSDIESFFVVNDSVCFCGGCGLLQQAKKEIADRHDIDFIVITDNLVDATCIEALKSLSDYPAKKIVAIKTNDSFLKEKISRLAVVIDYPYTCNVIEDTIKQMLDAPSYGEDDLERIADSNISSDNPFSTENKGIVETDILPANDKKSFKERLKNTQLSRFKENNDRVLQQKIIAVQSQKGGVGKSTVVRELAIALSCIQIKNDALSYRPKVCLCDFDFESADISAIMNLEGGNSILNWCEDIDYESEKNGEAPESIRFTENIIKERYLKRHESGVYVLCAPECKTDCFKIKTEYIKAITENLRLCDFDIVLIDTGPNILDYTLTAFLLADEIFAVCNCDLLSARSLDGMITDVFNKMQGFNYSKLKLVINRLQQNSAVSPDEIKGTLDIPLIGEIPYFPEATEINNEGVSVFLNRRKQSGNSAEYANAFKKIAREIVKANKSANQYENEVSVTETDSISRRKMNFGIFRK